MDCALSPIQQRNLEKAWNTKVLDRTGLILEIFGRRAKTKEGALQVELAHLNYQRSRLVRSWTHLERQRGGFGFMGGPGETQIEADRRLIGDRITRLENELKKVQATRRLHRAGRQRVPYRVVALVGYTNAGKSTLFNRLTRADVQAADMLFATLDPTLRALTLPHGGKAMLSDTVGFISNLPTQLVAAFRATLEEVLEADIILHVRDMSHEDAEAQERDVDAVLRKLGIDPDAGQRVLEVWNKIDRFDPEERENLRNIAARRPPERPCFLVSAETGEGVEALLTAIEDRLAATRMTLDLSIDAADGAGISWLHRNSEVLIKELHERAVRHDRARRRDQARHRGVPVRRGAARGVDCRSRSTQPRPSAFTVRRRRRLLLALGFVPQRVHFGQRRALERTAFCRQRAFDIGKAAFEFGVGAAQRGFRIGADMARQIDQREQEIAGFGGEFVGIAAVERSFDLVGFLADLVQHRARVVPVEANRGRLALQSIARVSAGCPALTLDSSDLCSACFRRPARGALGLFLGLDAIPGALDMAWPLFARPCRRTHADAAGSFFA